jgi:L-methionine (R)-S-oxide reductase
MMSKEIYVSDTVSERSLRYKELMPQLIALIGGEKDWVANTANLIAALKETLHFFWIGCYRVKGDELVLGPFQGPVACTKIAFGKGVCGTAWKEKKTVLVPDVDLFPGHIACNSLSRSEIVVPVIKNNQVVMVIDVDSDRLNDFDQTDVFYLEQIAALISNFYDETVSA